VKCLTPNLLHKLINFLDMKVGPLSNIISIGNPYQEKKLHAHIWHI
jgi:hypothetical protein